MLKKTMLVTVCILSMLLIIGCGNDETAPEQEEETISIEIANKTEEITISFAVFFGENLGEWGEDLLQEEVIEPGETYNFVLPEGNYDLSLLTFEFYVIHGAWNINEDIRIEVGGEGKIPVLFENNSESDIALVYLSPSDSDDWGEDWLGERGFIPAETGRRFFFVAPGIYDFLLIDLEGETVLEVYELSIDSERTFTID